MNMGARRNHSVAGHICLVFLPLLSCQGPAPGTPSPTSPCRRRLRRWDCELGARVPEQHLAPEGSQREPCKRPSKGMAATLLPAGCCRRNVSCLNRRGLGSCPCAGEGLLSGSKLPYGAPSDLRPGRPPLVLHLRHLYRGGGVRNPPLFTFSFQQRLRSPPALVREETPRRLLFPHQNLHVQFKKNYSKMYIA